MDISTATRNLRPLTTAGYITMRASSSDARRREVRLTAKGGRALEKARTLWNQVQGETLETFGERRHQQLLTLLSALR
jgi:DNA-binding MarR family transcriptional regulator